MGTTTQGYADGNWTNQTFDQTENLVDTIVVPAIWCPLVLAGSFGNGLVVYVLLRHGERSTTNYYIINLAMTDLAFLLICVPFTMMFYAVPSWSLGESMCRFVMYMIYVTLHSTCFTLTAMTVDRYFAIVHAVSSLGSRTRAVAVGISIVIWVVSFLISLPFALYHELQTSPYLRRVYCREHWPSETWSRIMVVYIVMVTYIIPLATIILCYKKIIQHLYRQAPTRRSQNSSQSGPGSLGTYAETIQTKKRKRVIKMVAVVVALFATFWLPIHVFQLWIKFDLNFPRTEATYFYKVFAHTLSYANSVVNPIVYSFLGEGFKKAVRRTFPRLCGVNNRVRGRNTMRSTRTSESLSPSKGSIRYPSQRAESDRTQPTEVSRITFGHRGSDAVSIDASISHVRPSGRRVLPPLRHRPPNDSNVTLSLELIKNNSDHKMYT